MEKSKVKQILDWVATGSVSVALAATIVSGLAMNQVVELKEKRDNVLGCDKSSSCCGEMGQNSLTVVPTANADEIATLNDQLSTAHNITMAGLTTNAIALHAYVAAKVAGKDNNLDLICKKKESESETVAEDEELAK